MALVVTPSALPRLAGRRAARSLLVPAARRAARRALPRLSPGATVVTVSWNSLEYLRVLVDLVERRSPAGTRILVVDNGSSDGTRRWLASRRGVHVLRVPLNLGHEIALDLGFLRARTEHVVALDVDAFPLRDDWLDRLTAALDEGAVVAGARLNRDYVHPCCLVIRLRDFVAQRLTFSSGPGIAPGERLSARVQGRRHYLEVTEQRGPGDVGTVFGGLVYHNFYSTRFALERTAVLDGRVHERDPERAWHEALARWG